MAMVVHKETNLIKKYGINSFQELAETARSSLTRRSFGVTTAMSLGTLPESVKIQM